MRVGDLIQANRWFPNRKTWNEPRTGIVLGLNIRGEALIKWSDSNKPIWESVHNMNQGSAWMKVISETR